MRCGLPPMNTGANEPYAAEIRRIQWVPRQAPQNGSHRDPSGRCQAPITKNGGRKVPLAHKEETDSARKTGKHSKMDWRNGRGRREINEHGPAANPDKAKCEMAAYTKTG